MKTIKLLVLLCIAIICSTLNSYSQTKVLNADSSQTITIKVKGVTCAHDLKTIASNVQKLTGVKSCTAGKMGPTSSFEVKYNPAQISLKAIHSAIENTGGCENPNDKPYKVKL